MSLPLNPAIRISLTGLLVLRFDKDRKSARFGVHRPDHQDHKHILGITIKEVFSNRTDVTTLTETDLGLDNICLDAPVAGVTTYENGPFDRDSDLDDPQDFRWAIDIEGGEFHGHKLPVKTDQLQRNILINHGTFYTGARTPVTITREQSTKSIRAEVAFLCGVNLYLKDEESLILRYGDNQQKVLTKTPDNAFIIAIEYTRHDKPRPGEVFNDFSAYYEALDAGYDAKFSVGHTSSSNQRDRDNPCEFIYQGATSNEP
ncbi:MAG: hypothetical protein ACKV2V_20750 [Blastocatellia bacterium]